VGLQAHPEFCTRPLNPSPPFLGFVAAASGASVIEEQITRQRDNYIPPHPAEAMVDEQKIVANVKVEVLTPGKERVLNEPRANDSEV
jgi:CTP synthase